VKDLNIFRRQTTLEKKKQKEILEGAELTTEKLIS
jgi:hypothetical protein